jgi:hypothetical protein
MPTITIKPRQKLLIVGPTYGRLNDLSMLKQLISQYDHVIFNSGLLPNNIEHMQALIAKKRAIYVIGRSDYLFLRDYPDHAISQWIRQLPNAVLAEFPSRNVVIIDGGIPKNLTKKQLLAHNLEVSFISNVQWHQTYNGSLGYVITNNPLTDQYPTYYHHSLQLGNIKDSSIYAQEIDDIGLKKIFTLA